MAAMYKRSGFKKRMKSSTAKGGTKHSFSKQTKPTVAKHFKRKAKARPMKNKIAESNQSEKPRSPTVAFMDPTADRGESRKRTRDAAAAKAEEKPGFRKQSNSTEAMPFNKTAKAKHFKSSEKDGAIHKKEFKTPKEDQGRINDKNTLPYPSPGSGYESEDSYDEQCDNDTSDLISNLEVDRSEEAVGNNKEDSKKVGKAPGNKVRSPEMVAIAIDRNYTVQTDSSDFVLKIKSVFKCRLCPRILCLNEETVRTHLASKRHAWSKKLHDEGRLKLMLNSDGELEEELETHAERHARILALSQQQSNHSKKKDNGRFRQNRRKKKRMQNASTNKEKSEPFIRSCSKKRHTVDNIR